jgi:cytochrome c5
MVSKHLLGLALSLSTVATQAQQLHTQKPLKIQPAKHQASSFHSEGERVFAQNCSRCHNAPEGFSQRIAGTIARHMRVRAQLSQHDEQELLRFLNP